MFRHGEISTEIDKAPFFFTLAAFVCCLTAAVLLFVLARGQALAVFAGILLAIVALAALAVLFAMLTDRAYIEDEVLVTSYLFRKTKTPIREIGKITLKDQVYSVYDRRGRPAGTINAQLTGIDGILLCLDKKGVPFL